MAAASPRRTGGVPPARAVASAALMTSRHTSATTGPLISSRSVVRSGVIQRTTTAGPTRAALTLLAGESPRGSVLGATVGRDLRILRARSKSRHRPQRKQVRKILTEPSQIFAGL